MSKKYEESKYAKFFIDRLNLRYGLDYKIAPNEKEGKLDSDVDVYAVSDTRPTLNIQLITRESTLKQILANLQKRSKLTGKTAFGPGINYDMKNWIIQAIEKKEGHYPTDVKRQLILLITGGVGILLNIDYARKIFTDFDNSDFKGIYSVQLPFASDASRYPHGGQIIAIKDIFNNYVEEL